MAERITGHTELIGLMAYPIRHSSSPAMHNEAFAKLGLDYAYLAFEVDNDTLEDAVKGLRALKMRGSNVSMPNKTVVHKYLDKLSPAAEMCGAVNTIVNDNGVLTGHITDGIGYMQSLKDNEIDVIGKKMTIVGAGGAATAIEIQAALDGVKEMSIFNLKDKFWDNAQETVRKINEKTKCKAVLCDLADLDKLKEDNYKSCELLATKRITETDVYYIDYSEFSKKGQYGNYVIKYTFSEKPRYNWVNTVKVGCYNINNEAKYTSWKKEYAEQFINN